jgi:hypothetical protein
MDCLYCKDKKFIPVNLSPRVNQYVKERFLRVQRSREGLKNELLNCQWFS